MKYKHKKLGWIAKKGDNFDYTISGATQHADWSEVFYARPELVENSNDWEEVKESKVPDSIKECKAFCNEDILDVVDDLIDLRNETRKRCDNWKPDWTDNNKKDTIVCLGNKIKRDYSFSREDFLSFPYEEVADEFLSKHEDLIKQYFKIYN